MKKIIITESQLNKIVSKVVSEQGLAGQQSPTTPFFTSKFTIPQNINPFNLKLGNGGRKDPKNIEKVNQLQQKLIDLGYLKTDTGKPTGYFGPLTQNALDLYSKRKPVSKSDSKKIDTKTQDKKISTQKQLSPQVQKQLQYLKENNLLRNDKFTILDDKNSRVHLFNPEYTLFKTLFVITGKNRGDVLKTQTMSDYIKTNWRLLGDIFKKKFDITKPIDSFKSIVNEIDSCYFGQEEWEIRNTPSGIFKRAGTFSNFMNDWLATTFMEKDYGSRFITWETLDGKTIPFGFHGTKNQDRLKVLNTYDIEKQNCKKRKMSFGCVNFNDNDVKIVNDFVNSGQISIWLPDETNNIVQFPQKKSFSDNFNFKNPQ
jgi:hypothetical protein